MALLLGAGTAFAAPRQSTYQNFNLPNTAGRAPSPEGRGAYQTDKFQLGSRSVKLKTPNVDTQLFLFAKETFLSEKRDEAIKLLRQQIDAGMKDNLENMLLRLGQLYAEKFMELSYFENEVFSAKLKEQEIAKATNPKAPAPKLENGRSREYLAKALEVFYNLENKYPRHQKIDEVIFFIGFVEMENGHSEKGVRYLEKVVRQYPDSRKFDDAVVFLGDYYFDKANFKLASSKYQILLNRRQSSMHDYAVYKMAWCKLNLGQGRQGLTDLKSLVARLKGNEEKGKFNLREQAMRDLVVFYGEVGAIAEAKQFFKDNMSHDVAIKNLRLLADLLRSKARDAEAVAAYNSLLEEDPNNSEAPQILLGIYESQTRLGKAGQAVGYLVRAIENYGEDSDWYKSMAKDKPGEAKEALASLQGDGFKAATFYHNAAQKGANPSYYDYAVRVYTAMLNHLANHPERKKIAFYRGEALFKSKKWLSAAESYMAASKVQPKDKMTDESVYNALLALDELTSKSNVIEKYDTKKMSAEEMGARDIPGGEAKFIEVGEQYLREFPSGQRLAEVHFRMGAIYYRYHHFDKALASFDKIPTLTPKHPSATTAAHIVLDIHNLRKDYPALDGVAERYAGIAGLGDAKFKTEMTEIRDQLGFKKIEGLEKGNKWTEAGDAYLNVYKANPAGKLAEQSLYNAVVTYEKSGDNAKATEVTKLFIAKYPKSEYAQKLTLRLASLAEKRYDFAEAQRLYGDYWKKFPKDKEAKGALYNAAVFAELLEQHTAAIQLYETYVKNRFASKDEELNITLSEAKMYRKQNNWGKVTEIYRRLASRATSAASRINYLGELAHQYDKGGRQGEKIALLKEMRSLYLSAKGARLTGHGLQYTAEAMFRATDKHRGEFDAIKLRFPPQDLVYSMRKRQNRLKVLAKEYDDVVSVGVPDWGVAALYEKGASYASFAKAIRAVDIPGKYTPEQRTEAQAGLKEIETTVVLPLEKNGAEITKACVDRAVQFYVANDYAAKCHEGLVADKDKRPPTPQGVLPQPAYWSTRPYGVEVAFK